MHACPTPLPLRFLPPDPEPLRGFPAASLEATKAHIGDMCICLPAAFSVMPASSVRSMLGVPQLITAAVYDAGSCARDGRMGLCVDPSGGQVPNAGVVFLRAGSWVPAAVPMWFLRQHVAALSR